MRKLGRIDEAVPLYEQAFTASAKSLSAQHPDSLASKVSLTKIYFAAGHPDKANLLDNEIISSCNRMWDTEPSQALNTARILNALGLVFWKSKRLDRAIPLLEETLGHARVVLGKHHPETLETLHILANSYSSAGSPEKALPALEDAYALSRVELGSKDRKTLAISISLADIYGLTGQWDNAVRLCEQTLRLHRETAGPEHPNTIAVMHRLAKSYHAVGRREESIQMYKCGASAP